LKQTALPKLRNDLVFSRQETAGGVAFVVKDPVVGRFLRFKEPEYFIAQQFDGTTSLEEVRRRGETRLGGSLSPSTIEQFTHRLETLGLLETESQPLTAPAPPRPQGRVRGNAFYLRFKVFDPDELFIRLIPRLRFFFTPTFAWLSICTILLAAGITVASWEEIHRSLPRLYRVETIVLAWLTFVGIVIGHEFSHGLMCKRFGGKVHEVGLLLIYLQPAMYCNVSDAWLFPEKSKRLLVTLAGAWFEIFCWALATLAWRLTELGTIPNYFALVFATTLGIKSLFNLNPLIKLDGYYLLSDWLEVPNLRRKAFEYIGARLLRPWRAVENPPDARERRILWLYGLLAASYSGWLIGLILLSLGSFMVARYQAWGFVGFATLVATVFRGPLRRIGNSVFTFVPRRGMLALMKRLARSVAVLAVVGAALFFIHTDLRVSGEFRIMPIHDAEIRAEVEGIVEEIARDEGDSVAAGDLIARLSDRDLRAELDKVTAEITEREALLKKLKAGPRLEEIELGRSTVSKGEERLKFAQDLLVMEKSLYESQLSSKKDYDTAAEMAALRAGELEESRGTLKLLLAGARPEEIEANEAAVSRLTAQRNYLQDQLKRLRIVSPIAGVVTTHRLKEKIGTNLKKGDLFAEVHQLKTVTAEIDVPEKEISDVHIGQPVTLKARAFLNNSFHGTVVAISPVASKPGDGLPQRNFLVMTELDNTDMSLRPEMTGNAKISCGRHRLYEIVFRRFIRFIRVEFWSWW
jgi:multidrug resistance efflux pump